MQSFDVVIVGAGHAGAQCAIALRQSGFEGAIGLVTAEADPPYERPPLSKDYLSGEKTFERILLRPPGFWPERGIELFTERRIVSVDPRLKRLVSNDGHSLGYSKLVWAAGGHARRLNCEGADLAGVHRIRTRADVDRLQAELKNADNIVIIGGGYVGLEAAAVLVKSGKSVTVLEALDRVLARVAGEALSRFYEKEHRDHGVDVRLGVSVQSLVGERGRVTGVRLADGSALPCQIVIAGIGIEPVVLPLTAAGAAGANGVDVDAYCRTTLPDIYAIGDCANHVNAFADGRRVRLESVQNANDQANTVANDVLGRGGPYHATPWFWSNQYDLRLQTVGLSIGFDDVVVRGEVSARAFSLVYLKNGRVIALDCVNVTRDYVQGRALVEKGAAVDRAKLGDTSIPLKLMASIPSPGPDGIFRDFELS